MEAPSVNPSFLRSLKTLDRRLDCVFRREHEHFVITYDRGWGDPVNILLVQAESGGFRQPDNRELAALSEGDMCNQRVQDRLAKAAKYMQDVRDKDFRDRRDMIRNRTKDDKIQLMDKFQHAYGSGKHKAAFRPITYRGKSKAA